AFFFREEMHHVQDHGLDKTQRRLIPKRICRFGVGHHNARSNAQGGGYNARIVFVELSERIESATHSIGNVCHVGWVQHDDPLPQNVPAERGSLLSKLTLGIDDNGTAGKEQQIGNNGPNTFAGPGAGTGEEIEILMPSKRPAVQRTPKPKIAMLITLAIEAVLGNKARGRKLAPLFHV